MTDLETPNDAVEARSLNLDPITGTPGSHPIGTGIGAAGGMSAGVAIGTMVGGPLGSAVGGVVGAVAGAIAGSSMGEVVNPTADVIPTEVVTGTEVSAPAMVVPDGSVQAVDPVAEDLYWQRAFITEPYFNEALGYDDYGPAYRVGIAHRLGQDKNSLRSLDESEAEMAALWERRKGLSSLRWVQARDPALAAWQRVDHTLTVTDPYFGNS